MKRPLIKIGQKTYKFKKDAIEHYKAILNSYDFGQSLNDTDFNDLLDLLDYGYSNYLAELEISENDKTEEFEVNDKVEIIDNDTENELEITIDDIKVSRVQFNTKCFELFYSNNTSAYISYLMIINNTKYTPEKLFYAACRNSIHNDIRAVKKEYFDRHSAKGQVKCQETGLLSQWAELVVDHRQPNTFSVIVDRFKEINSVDLSKIEYTSNEQNHIVFKDSNLTEQFKKYHKEKATLRIVKKECNSSRTSLARIKRTSKDLTIK